ncbi:MAG: phosphatase PAP2 family protein [Candidatus Micrarchaeota archaeon]
MDVTAYVAGLESYPFTLLAVFFHEYAYSLVAILSLLTVPYFRKRGRYYALAVSMVLVIVLALFLKSVFAVPRPCNEWLDTTKVICPPPEDYGLPSGHTAFAFVFVAASLGTAVFPLYLIIGIVVGLSRIYLGVHSVADVAGGVALGVIVYLIVEEWVDSLVRKYNW